MKLEIKDLSVAYGGKQILEGLSLSVRDGITVLLGRNGAGKSTLLRCLTGEKRDYKGEILLEDAEVRSLSPNDRAKRIGYLPQELPQPRFTVEELVSFGRSPYLSLSGKLTRADANAVKHALEITGMTDFAERLVDSLSGGERQKAFLAMVLAQDTPLVVLDEPTAQLDAAARLAFCDLLRKLHDKTGRCFLVVMHELPEALLLADRLAVLHEQTLAFYGTAPECLQQNVPQRCFGVCITGSPESGFAVKAATNT